MPSTLVTELRRQLAAGEPFVYAYYDGIDKVSHEYGLGEFYDAELAAADRLVADVLSVLPPGAALVITADHGQVDVGEQLVAVHQDVTAHVSFQSGEGRFRWLHARPGRTAALHEAAVAHHSDVAWVGTREETIDEGWWGPEVTEAARTRLGDVALVTRDDVAFTRPGRHRPVHARRPARLAHRGRDVRPAARGVSFEPHERPDRPRPAGRGPRRAGDDARPGRGGEERREAVEEPAKVMRIGSMIKQLLEEVRSAPLDEPARARLREIYETSVRELGGALSPDLRDELDRVAIPFGDDGNPSEAELRIAQAQLVGWLEGLFHGIQATLFAQQMAARAQLEDMRRQLPRWPARCRASQAPGDAGRRAPAPIL